MARKKKYDAIVMGVSAGGLNALSGILPSLKRTLPVAVIIVQHMSPESDDFLPTHLDSICQMPVCEAEDKMAIENSTIYVAPPGYHLLVEADRTFALSMEDRVNYSRPSVDVLFETAAETYLDRLIGVILTGANSDGAAGVERVEKLGGLVVVQDPVSAEVDIMPLAAIDSVKPDYIVALNELGPLLNRLAG